MNLHFALHETQTRAGIKQKNEEKRSCGAKREKKIVKIYTMKMVMKLREPQITRLMPIQIMNL